jgi:hypothetical protein
MFSACSGDNRSTWNIYWALRKKLEQYDCGDGSLPWIAIYLNGFAVDPEQGSGLPDKNGNATIFIKPQPKKDLTTFNGK